jgi:uncharacterized protein (TIGR03000 family)
MYGIVLAVALTAGSSAPEHWGCHGCHGCYGCCGCYGCWGCGGCYGCCGWGGCYGCCGCYGCGGWGGCYGCCGYGYAYSCYGGCCGCFGGCWGCGGCYGCYGYGAGYAYATPVYSYGHGYVASAAPVISAPAAGSNAKMAATVVIKAPADVKITVNGKETARRTTEEEFLTPELQVGRSYSYQFSAEATRAGKKLARTERVVVRPGERTVVDFSNLDREVVSAEPARLTIILPEGASVRVNDVPLPVKGKQTFETPKLEKGKTFYYTVKAELPRAGRTVTETKRVNVEAGKSVIVDFTDASTLTASR